MPAYFYSSTAGTYTLTGAVNAAATSLVLNSVAGLPASTPFKVVLEPGQPGEEIVKVTNVAGTTLTVVRGWDSSSATSHGVGVNVRHMVTAEDFALSRTHEDLTAAHGTTSQVVGIDDTQTLKNKTALAATAGTVGLVVKGASAQTADVLQVQDSAGTVNVAAKTDSLTLSGGLLKVWYPTAANIFNRVLEINPTSNESAFVIKGAAGQVLDLSRWTDNAGAVIAKVDKDGKVVGANITATNAADIAANAAAIATNATNITALQNAALDSGWVDITVLPGFAAMAGSEKPQVRKIGKQVFLRGGWDNAGLTASSTFSVGTVPVGYRPPINTACPVGSSHGSAVAHLHITSAGDCNLRLGSTVGAYYKMDRQSYLID